jgi:hypothetical protein
VKITTNFWCVAHDCWRCQRKSCQKALKAKTRSYLRRSWKREAYAEVK